jgi:hypothetical protein
MSDRYMTPALRMAAAGDDDSVVYEDDPLDGSSVIPFSKTAEIGRWPSSSQPPSTIYGCNFETVHIESDDFETQQHQSRARESARWHASHGPQVVPSPTASSLAVQSWEITENFIGAFLDDFFQDLADSCVKNRPETWELFYQHYYAEDFELIRPSGNAIDVGEICEMFSHSDFIQHSFILVSLDRIRILKSCQSAFVVYTADQAFTYKGSYNADRVVFSVAMELQDGKIKIVNEHRSKGRPIPKESRWDTTELIDHHGPQQNLTGAKS